MKRIVYLLFMLNIIVSCSSQKNMNKGKFIFYLHGRIIEEQGINAVSEKFGKYEYGNILETLKGENIKILSEARPKGTKVLAYAKKVVTQVDSLINKGISAKNITVIGASKGAIIAMQVSTLLKNRNVKFVLLAGSSKSLDKYFDFDLYGTILGIYEKSDLIAGESYQSLIDKSTGVTKFKEIKLNTNLGHGIVYTPLKEWVEPAKEWINK